MGALGGGVASGKVSDHGNTDYYILVSKFSLENSRRVLIQLLNPLLS